MYCFCSSFTFIQVTLIFQCWLLCGINYELDK